MESKAPQNGEDTGTPPEETHRKQHWHIVTLLKNSAAPVRHDGLEVGSGEWVTWELEVPSGSTVGLALRLPADAPVWSFGPFAALDVNVVDLDGSNRKVEITAYDAAGLPESSLSFDFVIGVVLKPEEPVPPQSEPTAALTLEEPLDPDTSLKIDKLSKPPGIGPGGRPKVFPPLEGGRWQKVLVVVEATPLVSLWSDWSEPAPPEGSNP